MKKRLAVLTAAAFVAAPTAAAMAAEFEGTVVSVDRAAKTFRLRDEGRTVTIKVTNRTRYERLAGFRSIRTGANDIEAIAHRSDGRWVASLVERSGRTSGGGNDDSGGDDSGGRRGRGSDD
jgi:uncharacterized membrane protein YgcG